MLDYVSHHVREGTVGAKRRECTVYSDSNALGQLVSICSHKRWYFSEFIELQILGTERPLRNVGVDNL